MELDKNLLRLQGVLSSFPVSASDHQKLQILSSVFESVDETAKQKMLFFLILNTRTKVTDLLKRDAKVGLLTDICQNLDFPALSYIIFNLNLIPSLSVIVSNGPAVLTVELLDGVFAYADSRAKIKGLEEVTIALFEKILKISRGIHKDSRFTSKLWEFMNTFGEMMWSRTSFENEELVESDMNNILETCLACVSLYDGERPLSFDQLYEVNTLCDDESRKDEGDGVREPDCKTKLEKYLSKLLDLFYDNFNYTFSYDPIESEVRFLSQNACLLREKLKNSDVQPSNTSYLNCVKGRPETELEKLSKPEIDNIMSNIRSGEEESKIWFRALINFPGVAENEEAVACLKKNLDLADSQDLMSVVSLVQEQLGKSSVSEILMELYFCCLKKMTLVDQLFHFENYFALEHRPTLENRNFDEELNDAFSKVLKSQTRDVAAKSILINFCIRSPVKTIRKICQYALGNNVQLNISVEDLKMLKAACLIRHISWERGPKLDIVTSVLCAMIGNDEYMLPERPFLINLILRLQKEKLLDENIETFIIKVIEQELPAKNYEKLEFALEVLRSSVKLRVHRSNEIVLLAFFSQLLNHASWSCSSFTLNSVKIREMVTSVINLILKSPKFSADGREIAWLRKEVMKSWEANRFYFCDLWYSYGHDLPTSSELYIYLLILVHTKNDVYSLIEYVVRTFEGQNIQNIRTSISAAFFQILPVLTTREWPLLLARVKSIVVAWLDSQEDRPDIDVNLLTLKIFTTSLYCLAQDMNRRKDMMPCFLYCIRNFGKMIQQNLVNGINFKYDDAVVFVEELLFLLRGIREASIRGECSTALSPIILEVGNRGMEDAAGKESTLEDLQLWFKKTFISQITFKRR